MLLKARKTTLIHIYEFLALVGTHSCFQVMTQ